jgi:hypothetical protein
MDREGAGDGTTVGAEVVAGVTTGAGLDGLGDTACTDGRVLGTTDGDAEGDAGGSLGTTGPTTGGTDGPRTGGTAADGEAEGEAEGDAEGEADADGDGAGAGGAAGTVTPTTELTVAPCESVTAMVGEKLPDPVGVPANTPSGPRVSPGGSEPETTV